MNLRTTHGWRSKSGHGERMVGIMNYWLVKSEPSSWSWDQQVAKGDQGRSLDRRAAISPRGKLFLVKMKKGDRAFFQHHSNEGKRESSASPKIIKEAYPDPSDKTGKFVCVDIKADKPLKTPVTMECRDQGRQAIGRHGAGEIFAAVGAAGDGGGMEDRLQDGRGVDFFPSPLVGEGEAAKAPDEGFPSDRH